MKCRSFQNIENGILAILFFSSAAVCTTPPPDYCYYLQAQKIRLDPNLPKDKKIENLSSIVQDVNQDIHLREFSTEALVQLEATSQKDMLKELSVSLPWSDQTRELKRITALSYWKLAVLEKPQEEEQVELLISLLQKQFPSPHADVVPHWAAKELARRGVKKALPDIIKSIRYTGKDKENLVWLYTTQINLISENPDRCTALTKALEVQDVDQMLPLKQWSIEELGKLQTARSREVLINFAKKLEKESYDEQGKRVINKTDPVSRNANILYWQALDSLDLEDNVVKNAGLSPDKYFLQPGGPWRKGHATQGCTDRSCGTDSDKPVVMTGMAVKNEWLDVSRLGIAHVSASSEQGTYHSVLNLFDDGKNYINNINYHNWLSMPEERHWVRLTFDVPVTISAVVLETGGKSANSEDQPTEFALELAELTETTRRLKWISDAVPVQGFMKTYELPNPVSGINELMIVIPAPRCVAVSELRVMGQVPEGVDTTPKKPTVLIPDADRHVIQIQRTFATDEELRLITIAENSYPDRQSVLAAAARERSRMETAGESEKLWWFSTFDEVRIPYAITADAVDYYSDLVRQYRRKQEKSDTEHRSKFQYSASIHLYQKYSHLDRDFTNVHVVQMRLTFSVYWGPLAALNFHKERTVILDQDGQVLAIIGDGPTSVLVS